MKQKNNNSKTNNTKSIKNNQNKKDSKVASKISTKNNVPKIKGVAWDLEPILSGKSFDEWIRIVDAQVETFKKYREFLNNNITPQKILEILQLEESIGQNLGRVEAYYGLIFSADTKNSESLAKMGQLKQMGAKISNDMLFFNLWMIQLDDKIAKKIIESKELQPYKYSLESMRKEKPYTKSEEIERIINIKDITGGDGYAELYEIITNSYKYEWFGKKITQEELTKFCREKDSKLRQKAYDLILTKYKDESTVLSEIYKNIVMDWCNEGITIRGHLSSVNVRNTGYDVSDKSVQALLNVIRKNVGIFNEYFKLKYAMNKGIGQKYPYSRYHLYAPFTVNTDKKYTYDESKKYILDTYKKFDQRFFDRAKKIFDESHVHSHPGDTKRGGAFCYSISRDITPYILLNHTDTLRDVFTMIHEFGHGIHDIFSGENQTDLERHASLTVCETASVFSEMILAERLLKECTDDNEKKYILTQSLDNQYATIIRQAYFVIFEIYAHEAIMKGATKENLDEEYHRLLKEQFGDMEVPEIFKHEWNYIPHIHEMPFYCYSYAWGNLFVLALYDMYKKEGKPFIEKYVQLLSAGGSDSPANLMKKLGIDAESEEFWQRGFNIIQEEIDGLRKLAK